MSGALRVWSAHECVLWTSCNIDLLMRLVITLLFTCQTKALVFCAPLSVERILVCMSGEIRDPVCLRVRVANVV